MINYDKDEIPEDYCPSIRKALIIYGVLVAILIAAIIGLIVAAVYYANTLYSNGIFIILFLFEFLLLYK